MGEFSSQVERLILAAGVKTQAELCRLIGELPGTISGWKSRTGIPEVKRKLYSHQFNICEQWLMDGTGPMRSETEKPAPLRNGFISEDILDYLSPLDREALLTFRKLKESKKYKHLGLMKEDAEE